jgi:hypothetical protein
MCSLPGRTGIIISLILEAQKLSNLPSVIQLATGGERSRKSQTLDSFCHKEQKEVNFSMVNEKEK